MNHTNQAGESAVAAVGKLSPALGVSGITLAGIHLQDWVLLATLLYTLAMIGEKAWRWYRAWKRRD